MGWGCLGFLSRIAGRLLRRDLENVLRDLHHTCKSNLTLLHSTGGYLPRSLPISKCPQTYFSPFVGSSIGGPWMLYRTVGQHSVTLHLVTLYAQTENRKFDAPSACSSYPLSHGCIRYLMSGQMVPDPSRAQQRHSACGERMMRRSFRAMAPVANEQAVY